MKNELVALSPEIDRPPSPALEVESDGAARLRRLAELARDLDAGEAADDACELARRVAEGRFYVACVGQFKRGKSTLINALIGEPILPVGFIPVTAVPTVIRYGERLGARVRLKGNTWREIEIADLDLYVSEERNPRNNQGVVGLEVFAPSPLLLSGLCLVDTPGLGSVFSENSAATEAFIPHIDAALVVLGADPPLAGAELDLIEAIAPQVRDLLVVLNKSDRTTDDERSAAAGFARELLVKRLRRPAVPIFEVSAAERLDARGPERDWPKLNRALRRLVRDSGRQLVSGAGQRGLNRLCGQLLAMLSEEREALRRPIEESERRIAGLKEAVAGAERSIRELGYLLMAEQQGICGACLARQHAFLSAVLPEAREEFCDSGPRGFGPSYRRGLMRHAQHIARRHVAPWLGTEQELAEQEYRRATLRFVQLGNELLERLAQSGMTQLAPMPHALGAEDGFRVKSRFTFAELIEVAQPASPLRWLADVGLGWAGAHRMIERDARKFLERLLETNSARVQSDIFDRLRESRNRLEFDIRKLLREVVRMAERALAQARQTQQAGAPAVLQETARLNRLESEIRALRPPVAASFGDHQPQVSRLGLESASTPGD
ncbi:MAG TPA: dynamin family protein [Terriglobia bacterium]|nr:dynamin family protein [Terriglobia bacterium]